jgi:hypothetical protein
MILLVWLGHAVLGLVRSRETAVLLLERGITAVVGSLMGQRIGWHRDKPAARPWLIDEQQPVILKTDIAVVFDAPSDGRRNGLATN